MDGRTRGREKSVGVQCRVDIMGAGDWIVAGGISIRCLGAAWERTFFSFGYSMGSVDRLRIYSCMMKERKIV